jgi:uncharacterized protein (DUF58 family)
MLILWIPLGVAIIYLLIRAVYLRVWDRGLSVELAFGQHAVSEGQQATLKATVTNAKLLPLPVLMLRYKMNRGLRMGENANATVTDKLNVVEYFSVLGNERVVREQKVEATRRGCYHIDVLNLMMPQLISGQESFLVLPQDTELIVYPKLLEIPEMWGICEKIIGDIVSRRRLFEDVFSFRGIRDYTRTDPLSAVNWKATARTGKMMVNLRDYTFGQEVRILLNLEEPNYRYGEDVLENAIRIAATVACRCISDRIPVSLVSNACVTSEEIPNEQDQQATARTQRILHTRLRKKEYPGFLSRWRKSSVPAPDSGTANADAGAYNVKTDAAIVHTGNNHTANNFLTNSEQYPHLQTSIFDSIVSREDSLNIHAGGSQDHIAVIGEALAKIDLTRKMEPFTELMRRERQNMADSYVTVCLISSGRSDAIIREAEAMARQQDGIFWICPLRKDEEDKQIPGSIDFRRMNI